MTVRPTAIVFCTLFIATTGMSQQRTEVSTTYSNSVLQPAQTVEVRNRVGQTEVVTEIVQVPGPDGRLQPFTETTTETTRIGTNRVETLQNVFGFDTDGRRVLVETVRSEQETAPDGVTRVLQNSWSPDLQGRLNLIERQTEERKAIAPNVTQVEMSLSRPGINEPLRESERLRVVERATTPDSLESESVYTIRDANGRWQATEMRNREVRTTSPSERVEQERVERLDGNARLVLSEEVIIRSSETGGKTELVTEMFFPTINSPNRVELNKRVRRTTTPTPDGGSQTVEVVEARVEAMPTDPVRVVERTLETTRRVGNDRWITERQVFRLNGSGDMTLAVSEREESTGQVAR